MTSELLAKSFDRRFSAYERSLVGHSLRVGEAVGLILDAVGSELAETFDLAPAALDRLRRLATVAGLLHDIGKATESFQAMASQDSRERHPFRHEHLSTALIFSTPAIRDWLAKYLDDADLLEVAMVVAGHHFRAEGDRFVRRVSRTERVLLEEHLGPIFDEVAATLGADDRPALEGFELTPDEGEARLLDYCRAGRRYERKRRELAPSLSIALGKALVVAADTVGSAHADATTPMTSWVASSLGARLESHELDAIVAARLAGHAPREFQRRVEESPNRVTLVTAGCGNGKTLAAYMWTSRNAAGRRLVFCYPTTGTSTAGFEDYLLSQSELERKLVHSRASVDVEAFQRSLDIDRTEDNLAVWAPDVLDRWGAKVVACTVDTVLSLMTHWRNAMAAIPLWAQSAFVFDEIHSYDRALFGALLEFLRCVRAPVLLMTASLSEARREALQRALDGPIEPIRGEPDIESHPRYRIRQAEADDATDVAEAAVRDGQKVLWVANTVGRAQSAFRALSGRGLAGTVYHSRFRYEDRVTRQEEVIKSFRTTGGFFVVATQVCEMSLDISADLLVTECAPFPSLVQRLGRLNRREALPGRACPCLVIEPEGSAPYDRASLDQAMDLVRQLSDASATSQEELARLLAAMPEAPYEDRAVPFLSQTWETTMSPLRSASPSVTVVREGDLADIARPRRRDVVRSEIPMPIPRDGVPDGERLHGALMVPDASISYSAEEGASWAS